MARSRTSRRLPYVFTSRDEVLGWQAEVWQPNGTNDARGKTLSSCRDKGHGHQRHYDAEVCGRRQRDELVEFGKALRALRREVAHS